MKKFLLIIICALVASQAVFADNKAVPSADNRIIDAVAKYNESDYKGAVNILNAILRDNPSNDAAHYYLGISSVMLNDMERAGAHLNEAVSLDPSNFWYRVRLAKFYLFSREPDMSIAIYEKLLKDFPKKSELYYELIDLYIAEGQNEKALETLDQIETVFGVNEPTVITRFQLLGRMGRQEEAYKGLQEYNKKYSSATVSSLLGDYEISMYHDSTALALYDEALDLMPGFPAALIGKSEVYRMSRRYDLFFPAVYTLMEQPQVNPQVKADYFNALVSHADPKYLKLFQSQYDSIAVNCIKTHPEDTSVIEITGMYYFSTGRKDEAEKIFAHGAKLYPESVKSVSQYAELLIYLNRFEDAAAYSMDAYRKFPNEYGFLSYALSANMYAQKWGEALKVSDEMLVRAASDTSLLVDVYSVRGDLLHQLGHVRKAYKAYDKALKINPRKAVVLNNYAYFLSLEGRKLKKAAKMSKVAIEMEPDNPTYLDTYGWILHLQGKSAEAKAHFKHAMIYGGKESVVILDHYAEVLYALKEYDLAFIYWNQALNRNNGEIQGLEEKINTRKADRNRHER